MTTSQTEKTDEIEFHQAGEWTAVYLNGQLQRVGDSYQADEWLQMRYGVKVIQDDAFMRGQDQYEGVAKTLNEVHRYRDERQSLLNEAEALRNHAADLEAEAAALAVRAVAPRVTQ